MKKKLKRIQWAVQIWWLRLWDKKATHAFYFSAKQDAIPVYLFGEPEWMRSQKHLYKGQLYSEMIGFEYKGAYCNWEDARLLGIGTYKDVTHTLVQESARQK